MKIRTNKIYPTVTAAINIMIEHCPANAVVVECGTYLGDTAAQMVCALVDTGKAFKFYAVDNFKHDNVSDEQKNIDRAHSGYEDYIKNIAELEVDSYINTIVSDSIEAADQFSDSSVYFLYVDDLHEYGHVKNELKSWLSKMVSGGIIFGDDYNSGVKEAFDEVFGNSVVPIEGGCYIKLEIP